LPCVVRHVPEPLLLAFSESQHGTLKIKADQIFSTLIQRDLWFLPRNSRLLSIGADVLFYQAGKGIVAEAKIMAIASTTNADLSFLTPIGLSYLQVRLELGQIRIYNPAVDVRPLVASLKFIANKTYWGHSFRISPRLILPDDVKLIKAAAAKSSMDKT